MLVTLGLLILLFVTYELWGTGIFTARAQTHLKNQFQQQLKEARQPDDHGPVETEPGQADPRSTVVNPKLLVAPPEGDALGEISIKKIDVDWAVVEGVQLTDLAKGPGHYPGTPLPGQIGNAAIAGHRTTHGAPFFRVNELAKGDKIVIKTLAGTYTYVVTRTPFSVEPTDYGVVANTSDAELTLTSCNPRYSAAQPHHREGEARAEAELEAEQAADAHQRQEGEAAAAQGPRDRSAGRVQQRRAVDRLGAHRVVPSACCGGGRSAAGGTRSRG